MCGSRNGGGVRGSPTTPENSNLKYSHSKASGTPSAPFPGQQNYLSHLPREIILDPRMTSNLCCIKTCFSTNEFFFSKNDLVVKNKKIIMYNCYQKQDTKLLSC